MKKLDEMDRNIQLQSQAWGYKFALLSLSGWTLFNIYQKIVNGVKLEMIPCFILCLSLCVQGFSQLTMKHAMIDGDEEYKEPNKVLQSIITAVVVIVVVLAVGTYFLRRHKI